jgi:FdrA protein
VIAVDVRRGHWADSARLMAAARSAEGEAGVERAACFMATPANLEEARALEMWDPALEGAGPDDLVIAVRGPAPEAGVAAAVAALDHERPAAAPGAGAPRAPRSIRAATADVALISVPGEYAALEAHKALSAGMDVMLFSDGVALEDEVALKRRAHALGRLVMGPGCGTVIMGGVGLGFANVVASGPIGVVAAAGTGAQEVTVLIDRLGSGVSACIGAGGRDLHEEVGAITVLDAIARLAADEGTRVIACVSKPPAPSQAHRVLDALAATGKPGVACFVGAADQAGPDGVRVTATLEDAAVAAVALTGGVAHASPAPRADWVAPGVVRGLFSGGTLCSEAAAILARELGDVASNAPAGGARRLRAGEPARGHACIDLGEEEFTRGRPHPMIDPTARAEVVARAGADPAVGVILLDVVLGYASHHDPAGALAPVLRRALTARPRLAVVAHVLGTPSDPQGLERQEAVLRDAGVQLCPTNASAARLAAALAG